MSIHKAFFDSISDKKSDTKGIVVVTNANDKDVNNALTLEIVQRWQKNGATIETFEFPLTLGLGHDLIDPEQPDQQIDIVYPQLIDLVADEE